MMYTFDVSLLMPTKKPRLVLYMNPEILNKLQEWAKDERRTTANLAIYLIEKALEDYEKREREIV